MRRLVFLLPHFLLAGTAMAKVASVHLPVSEDRTAEPGQASLFTLVKTVQAAPSGNYDMGAFARINYVPGRDRFVLNFAAHLAQPEAGCSETTGYVYKEYTADLVETGNQGIVYCQGFADNSSVLVGNDLYFVGMTAQGTTVGWQLVQWDAVTWAQKKSLFYALPGYPRERDDAPMIEFVNGQIDVSGQYNDNPTGTPPPGNQGAATHHQFFTTGLEFVRERILSDTPHVNQDSMIFVDGTYNFLSSSAVQSGNLILMRYDPSWNYLGVKTLKGDAHSPTGVVYDGSRFYVAYVDKNNGGPRVQKNIHVAAFDSSWNLLEDIAVTSYVLDQDYKQPDDPWLALRGNSLYVSWDQDTEDLLGQPEKKGQAFVALYEISTSSTTCTSLSISPTAIRPSVAAGSQAVTVTGSPAGCAGGTWSASTSDSWLSLSSASGTGSGSVTVSWTQNTSTARSGSATIAGNSLVVNQNGTPLPPCTEDATTMCLIGGRYQVTSSWKNQYAGGAVSTLKKTRLTDATGAFWLFDGSTYEYLIRINTATDNGRAWIAIPTFTDVEFWITVLDTVYGQTYTYHSAAGNRTLIYDPYTFVFP